MVELSGIEGCAPRRDLLHAKQALSQLFVLFTQLYQLEIGGAKRDRTADLLRAKQALSQLSYSPVDFCLALLVSPFSFFKLKFGKNKAGYEAA